MGNLYQSAQSRQGASHNQNARVILERMGLSMENNQVLIAQAIPNGELRTSNHFLIQDDQLELPQNGASQYVYDIVNLNQHGSTHNLSNADSVHSTHEAPSRLNSQNRGASQHVYLVDNEYQVSGRDVVEIRAAASSSNNNKSSFYQ